MARKHTHTHARLLHNTAAWAPVRMWTQADLGSVFFPDICRLCVHAEQQRPNAVTSHSVILNPCSAGRTHCSLALLCGRQRSYNRHQGNLQPSFIRDNCGFGSFTFVRLHISRCGSVLRSLCAACAKIQLEHVFALFPLLQQAVHSQSIRYKSGSISYRSVAVHFSQTKVTNRVGGEKTKIKP